MTKEYTPEEHEAWLKSLHSIPAGAAVVIENSSGHLLVVKANYRRHWTTPGGVIDVGESPKQAALREVAEEVGLVLDPAKVVFMSVVYRPGDSIDTYQFVFGAHVDDRATETIVVQEEEIEEYAFVSKEQVEQGDRLYAPIIKRWASENIAYYNEE